MSNKTKISINIDNKLKQTIEAIGVSKSHSSLTETILYLLKKAIYIETEAVTASYVQVFLKEELDILSGKLAQETEYALEEILSQQLDLFMYYLERNSKIALANLILTSNATAIDDDEAEQFREDALAVASEVMESE